MAPAIIAGRYEVIRTLGHGSFGRAAADWKAFELFEREAAVLRGLRHQGVPAVYETLREEWEGSPVALLVME